MKKYIPVLKKTKLFAGIANDEIASMLLCLDAQVHHYKKGEYVLREGEHLSNIMILVGGRLHIQKDDYWGNRSILEQISMGEMFGEAYIAPESEPLLNDVVAAEDSVVMFFNAKQIITTCSSACRFHTMVVQNLFFQYPKKIEKLYENSAICPSARYGKNSSLIYLKKPRGKTAQALQFHLTASNLPTFFLSIGAQCQMNLARCVRKGFWNLKEIVLSCYKYRV